jgi:hypothetical protein
MLQDIQPKFVSLSHSQVAFHPNPKGIIQFIGSFVFGSFPVCSYQYLHQYLFAEGYTLVLYRFPINPLQFNHWEVAFNLLQEQFKLRTEIVKQLIQEGSSSERINTYLQPSNYFWLGHSLGCKYIMLLEILSNEPKKRTQVLKECLQGSYAKIAGHISLLDRMQEEANTTINQLGNGSFQISQTLIRDQPSILLAPEISNTVRLIRSAWRVSSPFTTPNQVQTECMISHSNDLFNLMAVISFKWDNIAEDDVTFLVNQIANKPCQPYLYKELDGWHFEPLGIYIEDLGDHINKFLSELRYRQNKS